MSKKKSGRTIFSTNKNSQNSFSLTKDELIRLEKAKEYIGIFHQLSNKLVKEFEKKEEDLKKTNKLKGKQKNVSFLE